MLILLSPAKSLDYDTPLPSGLPRTEPSFPEQSARLVAALRGKSPQEIASLMSISDPLAALNVGRFAAWSRTPDDAQARQALLAFDGDVYAALDARSLGMDDLRWAQDHLAILSGLYGVLRPLDRMQPYRLEMGTRLATEAGADLYRFWGDRIARRLDGWLADRPADAGAPVLVNLASQEYARAVDRRALRARIVDCAFEEAQAGGGFKVVGVHAKRARGLMARHAIVHRIAAPEALRDFDAAGYCYDAQASSADRMVFRR
ncbi:MAG: peroxide stress protein YaaA [Xylophilus ampelinus]